MQYICFKIKQRQKEIQDDLERQHFCIRLATAFTNVKSTTKNVQCLYVYFTNLDIWMALPSGLWVQIVFPLFVIVCILGYFYTNKLLMYSSQHA